MRRPAPRRLEAALADLRRHAAPATVLAEVQGCWDDVAGPAISAEATPVREHGGTLTVSCGSAVWAAELELLGPELLRGLNAALPGPPGGPLKALRVRSGGAR